MKAMILTGMTLIVMITGCVKEVQPWEKETLAKKTMKDNGGNALLGKYEGHIFFSKEATKGGSGVAGGGCGCN